MCIHTPVFVCTLCHTPWRRKPLRPLPPCSPLSLIPFSVVKICFSLPASHMWSTLMCCIFNPTDLHFQKFPLPAQAWNEAQTQNVAVSTVPSAWAFVLIFFSLRLSLSLSHLFLPIFFPPSFSIQKIAAVAPGCWYLRFTNSNFLDELVKKRAGGTGKDSVESCKHAGFPTAWSTRLEEVSLLFKLWRETR